jgi:hypothetical protein
MPIPIIAENGNVRRKQAPCHLSIRKGQIEEVGKGDIRGQVRFVSSLFSIAV